MPITLMETLDEAAFGNRTEINGREIGLVLAAEQWLYAHGWEPHHVRGWSNVGRAFGTEEGCNGLWIRERRRGFWDATGTRHPVRSVQVGLNVLVNEEILPARFSTFGAKALADYAEALERAATRLEEEQDHQPNNADTYEARLVTFSRAAGLRQAAEVAREHDPISVLS